MQAATEKAGGGTRRRECDRPEDFVAGWFFPITMPAFQAALDIERSARAETTKGPDGEKTRRTWYVWTQRAEPQWAFVEGDTFHTPLPKPGSWQEQLRDIHWTVQVKGVLDQTVTIAVTNHRASRCSEHALAMDDLATLLRTGRLSPLLDLTEVSPEAPNYAG